MVEIILSEYKLLLYQICGEYILFIWVVMNVPDQFMVRLDCLYKKRHVYMLLLYQWCPYLRELICCSFLWLHDLDIGGTNYQCLCNIPGHWITWLYYVLWQLCLLWKHCGKIFDRRSSDLWSIDRYMSPVCLTCNSDG